MKRAKPSLLVHPRLKRLLLRLLHLSQLFLYRTVSVRHVVNIVVANHTIKLLTCNDFSKYKKRNIVGGGCVTDILSMIRQNREARGWTEYQLAERSGLPQSTISSWYKKGMTPSFFVAGKDLRRLRSDALAVFCRWAGASRADRRSAPPLGCLGASDRPAKRRAASFDADDVLRRVSIRITQRRIPVIRHPSFLCISKPQSRLAARCHTGSAST